MLTVHSRQQLFLKRMSSVVRSLLRGRPMKLILFLLLFPILSYASPWTSRVNAASTNIAATFPLVPQVTATNGLSAVQVDNQTASELEVNCTSLTKPASDTITSFYVAGYTVWETPANMNLVPYPLGKYCWYRSVSGTISTGVVRVTGWGY